jgi:hypothetical protein
VARSLARRPTSGARAHIARLRYTGTLCKREICETGAVATVMQATREPSQSTPVGTDMQVCHPPACYGNIISTYGQLHTSTIYVCCV